MEGFALLFTQEESGNDVPGGTIIAHHDVLNVLPILSGVCSQTLSIIINLPFGSTWSSGQDPPMCSAVYVDANTGLMFLIHFLLCLSNFAESFGRFYFLSHTPWFG